MIAQELRNTNRGDTLRLPDENGKGKHRRYLIDRVVHTHAGLVQVYVTGSHGARGPLVIAHETPVEVTP
ncbi:hypothetical protein [Rhodococcus opacus]|uniref:hypothetical protein n=1 Tax=Rhodococcus opacus TaxID=37919 RepID=UPI001C442429|nr:hypothetical protein [Rhodococcus opacus]MBV6758379.1 hypothetical protein [Rhodococcus opacus]